MKVEIAKPVKAAVPAASQTWSPGALLDQVRLPLFRNAGYLWLNTVVLSAFGFVFWTAAARLYPADAVGYGASAIAAMTLIAGFSHLGLGIGIIRFLPERRDSAVGLINSVFLITVVAGIVASVIFLLGLDLWAPGLKAVREHPVFFAVFLVGATAFSLSSVLDQVFVATRRAHLVLVKNLGLGALRILLVASLAVFFTSFGIVAAHAVAGGLLVSVSLIVLLPTALKKYRPALEWKPQELRSIASFSAGNYVGALLLLAPGNLFTLIVLGTRGPEDAGYFYIAWTIGMAVSSLALALSTSLFAEGSHDPGQLRSQAMRAGIAGSVLAVAAAAVVIAGADMILRAFGGDYASNGATLLRLLAVAGVPYLLVNLYLGVARVQKRIVAIVLIAGVTATVSLVAGYFLVESVGLKGIGFAWIAGQGSALAIAGALVAHRQASALSHRHQLGKSFTSSLKHVTGGEK